MNIKKYTIIACIAGGMGIAGLSASCTGAFDEINTNPNSVPYGMMLRDNLITGSAIGQLENYCISADANQYQRMFNLAGDIYAGYFGATNTWNNNNNGIQYVMYPEWYNVAFEVGYERIMAAWRVVDLVREEEPQAFALAQILKIFGMHKITDMYGPIPYSQFGTSETATPYDSQEAIYRRFFTELDEAVDVLVDFVQLYPGAYPLKNYDAIYQGDYGKWIKFANTLKLRLAMRMAYVDEAAARQHAEEAVNHPAGLLADNADNAFYPVPQRNPLNEIWDAYQDARMGGTIACYLNGFGDPRREVYFSLPSGTTTWNGVRSGTTYSATNLNNYRNRAALPNVGPNDPLQWMVAAESHFLRAEGALRGWNMGGAPKDLYEQGVRTSFDQRGVSAGYAAYIANATATPANLSPAIVSADAYTYSPANTITIAWDDADDFERKLERIITQKYLALFPDGQEAWSEFRRTGYPRVIPVRFNRSPANTINTAVQIRRLVFPTTEYDKNSIEVQKAVEMIGGADHGGVKLWWDKKN